MSAPAKRPLIAWRGLRRCCLLTLALLLIIATGLLAAGYTALRSERGTQWALRTVQQVLPELSFTGASGTFLQGLAAEQIRWRSADIDIVLDHAELHMSFAHLLHGNIHLPYLRLRALRITPLKPSSDAPVVLPTLFLPFSLSIDELAIDRLEIIGDDSPFALHDIRSGVVWRGSSLRFTKTHVRWNEIRLDTQGSLGFRGDYPLFTEGKLTLPQWPTAIALRSRGDLRRLELIANTDQPYRIGARLTLATLDQHLPAQLRADLQAPVAQTVAGEQITIEKASLDAHGDLTDLQARLTLTANDARYGSSELLANARWRNDRVEADGVWRAAKGMMQLRCDASAGQPIEGSCAGEIAAFDLTPFLSGATAELSGKFTLAGKWLDPQWSLALNAPEITGRYNDVALSGELDLQTDDGVQWQLRQLALAIGPNTAKASGKFGERYDVRGVVEASDLSHLHTQMGGSLSGRFALAGEDSPSVSAQLRATRPRWGHISAAAGSIDVQLAQLGSASSSARLNVQRLKQNDSAPANLTIELSGNRSEQRWALDANQAGNRAMLRCRTRSDANLQDWQYSCENVSGALSVNGDELAWRNSSALRGTAKPVEKTVDLAPFCLRSTDAELCLDQTLRVDRGKLQAVAAHAAGIPLRWAGPHLPDAVELLDDPRAAAQVQLRSLTPLDAHASVSVPATRWRWRTATARQITDVNALHIDATANAQQALLRASLQAPRIGSVDARLAVADPLATRALDGRVEIEQLQLAGLAWAFSGLDAISGEINGAIDIGGTTAAPQLRGQLLLKNGSALWAPLGAPFRTVHADLSFSNDSAQLGGWFALGEGGGDIDGDITWNGSDNAWKLRLGLVAGGVSAMPLPNSTVVFSPHTELLAEPGKIRIDGYIDIASADIRLKELPPQTIDVSQDQEIVGENIEDDAWKIWMQLGVNLGDQFHLSGFGADVDLNGRLQLSLNPGDNLHLNGEVKVPRGRYRAYGQRLTVRKGSVIFYGPPDNPDLNLEAVRDMPPGVTDVVGMRVIGSLKTPEAILFSEPSMPDSDIAYYLLTGRKPAANATGAGGFTASGALLSLGLAGSEDKAGQLARKFGISDLQLGTSEGKNGESEAEVSGQLGEDLYVRYGRGLGQKSNSISFQYRLTPRLMIETISGIDDALDLLYSFEIE